jgi:peptidoglycan/LPS O-acetylase OafA/YrhL
MQCANRRQMRIGQLDLLRFIAATSVMFYHYMFLAPRLRGFEHLYFPSLVGVTQYLFLGVQLFFLISGFVILKSAQNKSVVGFLFGRMMRIVPAFLVACTLTFLITQALGPESNKVSWLDYLGNMTTITISPIGPFFPIKLVDGVYWTLQVEAAFYALIAIAIQIKLIKKPRVIIVLWLLVSVLAEFAPMPAGKYFQYLRVISNSPYFISGMLFFLLKSQNGKPLMDIPLLLISYLLALFQVNHEVKTLNNLFHFDYQALNAQVGVTIAYVLMAIFIFGIQLKPNPIFTMAGLATYPLYLIHENIGESIFHTFSKAGGILILFYTTSAMLVLSVLINLYIEKPVQKFIPRILPIKVQEMVRRSN